MERFGTNHPRNPLKRSQPRRLQSRRATFADVAGQEADRHYREYMSNYWDRVHEARRQNSKNFKRDRRKRLLGVLGVKSPAEQTLDDYDHLS